MSMAMLNLLNNNCDTMLRVLLAYINAYCMIRRLLYTPRRVQLLLFASSKATSLKFHCYLTIHSILNGKILTFRAEN